MLNFDGRTRRRAINLGTRQKTSKQDILERAQQERKKRADSYKQEVSSRKIQSRIRSYLWNKKFFIEIFPKLNSNQLNHVFPVFGTWPLHHVWDSVQFGELLRSTKEYTSTIASNLVNTKVISLLREYYSDDLLVDAINVINKKYLNSLTFCTDGLCVFLSQNSNINDEAARHLCQLFIELNLNHSKAISKIYESTDKYSTFLRWLGSYGLFPSIDHITPYVFDKLCYIAINMNNSYSEKLFDILAEYIEKPESVIFNGTAIPDSQIIFEKEFIDRLLNKCQNSGRDNSEVIRLISALFKHAPNSDSENKITVSLLPNSFFCSIMFSQLKKTQITNSNTLNTNEHSFQIACFLIDLYLQLATDADIISTSSYILLDDIIYFTNLLKNYTFEFLWKKNNLVSDTNIDRHIKLLNSIYLRDSRSDLFSQHDKGFWIVGDDEFGKTSLHALLFEYEDIYNNLYKEGEIPLSEMKERSFDILVTKRQKLISVKQIRKLEIFIKAPFFITFDERVDLFYTLIAMDRRALGIDNEMSAFWMGESRPSVVISRENILDDAVKSFAYKEKLKSKISVTFTNEFGREEGIDGGGVTKEFLTSVADEGFKDKDEKYGLFLHNDMYEIYPKPTLERKQLEYMRFLGKVIGKCLYDHVLIDVTFADFFLKKLLTNLQRGSVDDLRSMDNSLYNNLTKLLMLDDKGIEAIDMTFEFTDAFNPINTTELIKDGSKIKVTRQNILQYISRIAEYKLDQTLYEPISSFYKGLTSIITPYWIDIFNTVELQMLISGGKKSIDLVDLKKNVEYGGFLESDITIKYLWEVLNEFTEEEKRKFLKFVTSVPHPPLRGFVSLEPKFGIRNSGNETGRLPTASTCVNLLKIPDYKNKALLKDRLLYAINSGARFDLS